MYNQPQLVNSPDGYALYVSAENALALTEHLRAAGFDATLLEETFGFEDLNTDEKWEVATIELPSTLDKVKLRKLLRDQ